VKYPALFVVPYAIVVAAVFAGIAKLNARAANKLQKQIDALEEARR
jgi:hypothetical protein